MRINKAFFCLILCLFSSASLTAQITQLPSHASFSALIRDLETGEEIIADNSEKTLISASLMKLVTTATALELLGPDFSFSTRFWMTGEVKDGILKGDLIIEGGGDPTLGSKYFPNNAPSRVIKRIKSMLEDAGVKQIEGTIYLDENYFRGSRYPSRRLWEDMGNYYGAPPSALSWRDNSFEMVLRSPSVVGELCQVVSVTPNMPELSFDCRVRAAEHNKDSAYIYGVSNMNPWIVRGSIPAGRDFFTIKGALHEPGLTFIHELLTILPHEQRLSIEKTTNQNWKHKAKLIGQLNSPPLTRIIRETNVHSINLAADHLLLALGRLGTDSIHSEWDLGINQIHDYWKNKTDDYYIDIKDGSGLAPLNTLSSGFLVNVLSYIFENSSHFESFKNSLARSGHSGTLKYIWREEGLKGNIYGKSGSMHDVMGYAGYVFRPGKSPLAFSFIANHHGLENREVRKILEKWLIDVLD